MTYYIINNSLATVFYILFFSWLFLKIRNISLIKKLNIEKGQYKEIKNSNKRKKASKRLFRISLCFIILLFLYFGGGFIIGIIDLCVIFLTLGGTAYVDTHSDPTFFYNFMNFVKIYFSFFQYTFFIMYVIVFIILTRAIYINICNYRNIVNKS